MTSCRRFRFGLGALGRDRLPFAVLGALVLSLQLFLAGLAGGAMAAAMDGDIICIGGGETASTPGEDDRPSRDCPSLASGCAMAATIAVPADVAALPAFPVLAPGASVARHDSHLDRRPLSLFARAGRSPPHLF